MQRRLRHLGMAAALFSSLSAHALNRVTLRNGFTYDCARQQVIDPTHTRLFLSQEADTSYVDILTAEIIGIDALPASVPHPASATTGTDRADIPTLLSTAGTSHNIDVELLDSLVHAESNGRTHAVSRTGAQGLMQLMPGTAHQLGVTDSFAADQNINGGTTYLDSLLVRYHDNLALALAAYNAGPAAVDRYHGVPPFRETRAYVAHVMTEFKRRKEALARKAAHPDGLALAAGLAVHTR